MIIHRTCPWCGAAFIASGRRKKAWKSCPACRTQTATLEQRYWRRVIKSPCCWGWAGAKSPQGYGWFWDGTRMNRAHRVSWEIHHGAIPPGLIICHHCDDPECSNPDHLYLGTHSDNSNDAVRRGRWIAPKGSQHSRAKLTDDEVVKLREAWAAGVRGKTLLDLRPDLCKSTIYRLVAGKTYRVRACLSTR